MNNDQSQRQQRQSNITNVQPLKNTYLMSPKRGAFTGQQTQNFDKSADRQLNIFKKSRPSNNATASFQNQPQKESSKGMIGPQAYSDQKSTVLSKVGVRRAQVSIERKSQNIGVGLSNNAKKHQNDKRSEDQDQTHLKSSRMHAYENQNTRMNDKSLSNRGDSHNIEILGKQNKNSQTQQVGQQKPTNITNPLSRFNNNDKSKKDQIKIQNIEFNSQIDNFDDQNILQYSVNINRNLNSQKKQNTFMNQKSGNYTQSKKATENVQAQRHQQHYLQMRNNQNINQSLNQSITSQGSTKDYGKQLQGNDSLANLSKSNVYLKNNLESKLPFKNDGNSNASETSLGIRVIDKSKQIALSTSPLKTGHRQSQVVVPSSNPIEITGDMQKTFDLVQAQSPIFASLKQGSLTAKKSIIQQPNSYYNQQNQQKYFLNQKSINVKQQDSLGNILNVQSKNHYLKIHELGRQFGDKSLSKSQVAMEIGEKSPNDYGNKERDASVSKQTQNFNMQRIFKSKSPSKKSLQLQQILRSINLLNSQKNQQNNRNTQSKNLKKSFITPITAQDMKNSTQKSSSLIRNFINQISNQLNHNHTKSHQNINTVNSGRNSRVDHSQNKQKVNSSQGNQSFINNFNPSNQLNNSNSNIQLHHKNNKHINPYIQAKNRQGSSNITGKGNQISNSSSQSKIMIIKESSIQLHNNNYSEIKNYVNDKINQDLKHVEDAQTNAFQSSQNFQIGAISVGEYVLQSKPKNQVEHTLSQSLKNKLENTFNQSQKQNPIQLQNFVNSEIEQKNSDKLKSQVTDRSDVNDAGSSTQRLLKKEKFLVGATQVDSTLKQNINLKKIDKNSARKTNNQKYISQSKANNQTLYFNKNSSHIDKNLNKPLLKKENEFQNEQKQMDGPSDPLNKLQISSSQSNNIDQFNQTNEKKTNFKTEFLKLEQYKTEKFSENIDEQTIVNPVVTPKMVSQMSASNLKSSMTAKLANKQKNRNNQAPQTLQKNVSGNLIKKETKYMAISFSSDNFIEENEQSPTNQEKNGDLNIINDAQNIDEQVQFIEESTLLIEQESFNQIQIDKVNINLKYLTQLNKNNQMNDVIVLKNIIYENPYKDQMEEKNVSNDKQPAQNENVSSQNTSFEKINEMPASQSSISAKNENYQKQTFFENQKLSDQYYTSQVTAKLPELEMKLSSGSLKNQNFDDKKNEKSQSATRNSMLNQNSFSLESLDDAFPLTHDIFLEVFQDILLEEEIVEIGTGENQFQNIYFAGSIPYRNPDKLNELKIQNQLKIKEFNQKKAEQEGESNNGEFQGNPIFDNFEGYYKVQIGDHLAYRYEIIKVLGKGSFAQVVQCRDHKLPGKPLFAVKITRNTEMDHKFAHKEAQYLKYIMQEDPQDKHNIVRMLDQTFFREHHCFVFELLHTDLFEHLKATGFVGFSTDKIRDYALQILKALVFLEKHKIIHCDLKPENILCADTQCRNLKMVDFGSGCFRDEQIYTYVQSRFYRSPEVIMRIKYSEKVDIWSLGCIIAELYTGEPIFPGNNEQEQLELIMELCGMPPESMIDKSRKKEYYFDSDYSPFLIEDEQLGILRIPNSRILKDAVPSEDELFLDFVMKCLEIDPERRFSASEAMEHPWIKAALRESLLKGKIVQQQLQDQRQNPIKRRTQQESISDDQQLFQPQIIRDKESFVREREGQEVPAEYSPERDIIVQRKIQKPNKETAFGIKLNNANNDSFQNSGSNGKRKQINIYGAQAQNEESKHSSTTSKGIGQKEIKVSQFIADQKNQQNKLQNHFVNNSNNTDSKINQPTMFQKQSEILKKNIGQKQQYEMISQQRNSLIVKTKISNIDFQEKLQTEQNEILNPMEPLDISGNELFDFQKNKIEQIDKYKILKGANTNKASSNQNNIFQMQQFSQKKNISTIQKEDSLNSCNIFLQKSIIPEIDFTNKYVRRGVQVQGQNSSFIMNNQGSNLNVQADISKNIGQIQDSVDYISEIQNVVSKTSQVLNSQSNQSPVRNKYGHGHIIESQFSPQVAPLSQMEQISQFLEDDDVQNNFSQDFNFQEESQIQESSETHRIQQLLNIANSPAKRAGGDSMIQGADLQVQDHQIRYSVAQANSPAIKKKKAQSKNYLLPSQ